MLKIFFAFIILIHGLIHFRGFTKAFGYGQYHSINKRNFKTCQSIVVFG